MLVSKTMVIYCGVLTLEKVGTAENYTWYFYNNGQKYHGILTLEKGGTMVNYCCVFITLATDLNVLILFTTVIYKCT